MIFNNRHIKSFVLRQGKITNGQNNAINELMPVYGINYYNEPLDLNSLYKSNKPKIIEIGFGMGGATWQIAKNNPDKDYLGIEVHTPGVGALLMSIKEHEISNLRVIQHDAVEVLRDMINNDSIFAFHIFFPDPWHKKKHHKRRIITPEFIQLLVSKLQVGGYIHLATDWEHYALWMLSILQQNSGIHNLSNSGDFVKRPDCRPLTKFEQRGVKLGNGVWDLMFIK